MEGTLWNLALKMTSALPLSLFLSSLPLLLATLAKPGSELLQLLRFVIFGVLRFTFAINTTGHAMNFLHERQPFSDLQQFLRLLRSGQIQLQFNSEIDASFRSGFFSEKGKTISECHSKRKFNRV